MPQGKLTNASGSPPSVQASPPMPVSCGGEKWVIDDKVDRQRGVRMGLQWIEREPLRQRGRSGRGATIDGSRAFQRPGQVTHFIPSRRDG